MLLLLVIAGVMIACRPFPGGYPVATIASESPRPVMIEADGSIEVQSTSARTVADFLAEQEISLGPDDLVFPLPATIIPNSLPDTLPFLVKVTRVTESTEVIPESVPFQRKIIRSAEMAIDDPPRIVQPGRAGLQEMTIRIVYHDGLEVERWPVSVNVIEQAQDEIVLIGAPPAEADIQLSGVLAYIHEGRPIILGDQSQTGYELAIEGQVDGRVFQLSPDGRHLLYTISKEAGLSSAGFRNELFLIETKPSAIPQSLGIENVLWAAWDPAQINTPRIAYTTARTTTLPPGWEAINDLWLLDIPSNGNPQPAPIRLVDSYATPYGWWGGNYAWSPAGNNLAYGYATEIGLLEIPASGQIEADQDSAGTSTIPRTILVAFPEYDTGGEWTWIPPLSWAADSQRLAFIQHATSDSGSRPEFNLAVVDSATKENLVVDENVGIWSLVQWFQGSDQIDRLLYLRANDPQNSLDSQYAMWLSDVNGADQEQLFPANNSRGNFGRTAHSLARGPDDDSLAFIFENALHILSTNTGAVSQLTATDDTIISGISWAPYGAFQGRP